MEWIKRWAAIGDSYTPGIGAGRSLGHRITAGEVAVKEPSGLDKVRDNWKCSRYDMAYPKVMEAQLGAHVEKDGGFQYLACIGDHSEQICQQAKTLKGKLDFVTFASGGNNPCLRKIIADRIMLPYGKTSACETVIVKAQENAKPIIKGNIKEILEALDEKMKKSGVVAVNGYAQFFDSTTDNLDQQSWDVFWFLPLGATYRALTISRRNTSISWPLTSTSPSVTPPTTPPRVTRPITRLATPDGMTGSLLFPMPRMCSPSSNGDYPDPKQPDMHFIKPDSDSWFGWSGEFERTELRKRDMDLEEMLNSSRLSNSEKCQANRIKAMMEAHDRRLERTLYDSILFKSPHPRAAIRHKLDPQAPSPLGCPGDGGADMTLGMDTPDHVGQNASIICLHADNYPCTPH
jgi:hypothetical protein